MFSFLKSLIKLLYPPILRQLLRYLNQRRLIQLLFMVPHRPRPSRNHLLQGSRRRLGPRNHLPQGSRRLLRPRNHRPQESRRLLGPRNHRPQGSRRRLVPSRNCSSQELSERC